MKAICLRAEYLDRPIGLDITKPRFFWNCEGGVKQTAYQIVVKKEGGEILWDTGKVFSERMTHIRYEGKPMQSRDRVEWSVKLWDENGIEGEWSTSWFEMGLLKSEDWKAKWISGDYTPKKTLDIQLIASKKNLRCLRR